MAEKLRWAQLTYSSFDREHGSGGWQVKDLTGVPDRDETKLLESSVVTGFDYHDETSTYPSEEEIAGWPRRFSFHPTALGDRYVHVVQAGRDSTGRPGNTYSHVILDRRPERREPAERAFRPIDLWRSAAFATPYGVDQILESTVADDPGALSGPYSGAETALSIMAMPGYREPLIAALDAVQSVQHGGGMLVLVSDRQDWAALIISALTRLMTRGTARSVPFSLYERASALENLLRTGTTVAVVPTRDLELLSTDTASHILVDGEIPESTEDHHHVSHGRPIPRSEFSRMVDSILGTAEEPELDRLRATVERLSPGTEGLDLDGELAPADLAQLHVAWPLAMTICANPDLDYPAAAQAAAADLLVAHSPLSVGGSARLLPFVREVVAATVTARADRASMLRNAELPPQPDAGRSGTGIAAPPAPTAVASASDVGAEELWAALNSEAMTRSQLCSALLEHAYLLAAIRDDRWLDENFEVVGEGLWCNLEDGGELFEAVARVLTRAARECERSDYAPTAELKTLCFISTAGLLDGQRTYTTDTVTNTDLESLVDEILDSPASRGLAALPDPYDLSAHLPALSGPVRERLVLRAAGWPPPGCSQQFLALLAQQGVPTHLQRAAQGEPLDLSVIDTRLLLEIVRWQTRVPAHRRQPADPELVELAARWAPTIHPHLSSLDHELQTILRSSTLQLSTLDTIERSFPQWMPEEPITKLLAAEPWSEELRRFLDVLIQTRPGALPLALLRATACSQEPSVWIPNSDYVVSALAASPELSAQVSRELTPVTWCAVLDVAARHSLPWQAGGQSPAWLPDLSRFPVSDIHQLVDRAVMLWDRSGCMSTSVTHLAMCSLFAADQMDRMSRSTSRGFGRRRREDDQAGSMWPFTAEQLEIFGAETSDGEPVLPAVLSGLSQVPSGAFLTEKIDPETGWYTSVDREYHRITTELGFSEDEIDSLLFKLDSFAEKWRKSIGKLKLRDAEPKKSVPFIPGRSRPAAARSEGER